MGRIGHNHDLNVNLYIDLKPWRTRINTEVFIANYYANMHVFDVLFGGLKENVYFCRQELHM